jgi:hypothetical protein
VRDRREASAAFPHGVKGHIVHLLLVSEAHIRQAWKATKDGHPPEVSDFGDFINRDQIETSLE